MVLTASDAEAFHRDGYIRLPGIVPSAMVRAARREIFERMGRLRAAAELVRTADGAQADRAALRDAARLMARSGGAGILTGLLHETPLAAWLADAFGTALYPVRGAQIATLFPAKDDSVTNEAGYLNADTPHNGWVPHLDGLWNGGIAIPPAGTQLSSDELARWQAEPSTNGARRYLPELNSNIANFTALVGVALSDQRRAGCGNLGVLRGAHHPMGEFFRHQRDAGGPLGPEGPDWPREHADAPNGHGLVHYPQHVRDRFRRGAAVTEDGVRWPKPTFLRLRAGDAVVVHHATPHSSSRVTTADPRLMVYFRCIPDNRPEPNLTAYPDALCDIWLEWPGIRALCPAAR